MSSLAWNQLSSGIVKEILKSPLGFCKQVPRTYASHVLPFVPKDGSLEVPTRHTCASKIYSVLNTVFMILAFLASLGPFVRSTATTIQLDSEDIRNGTCGKCVRHSAVVLLGIDRKLSLCDQPSTQF